MKGERQVAEERVSFSDADDHIWRMNVVGWVHDDYESVEVEVFHSKGHGKKIVVDLDVSNAILVAENILRVARRVSRG